MSDFIIITDSTTDLPFEYVKENNLVIVPLQYNINNKAYFNYLDEREQTFKEFYSLMREGKMSNTSQVNSEDFKEVYIKYLKEGKDILGISFSSGLSGTFNSLRLAVEELKEEFPERKIMVVDSLSASMGEGLLVHYAVNAKKEGKTLEEVHQLIENLKFKICHWFTVTDIDLLRRGGRVSGAAAFIAKTIKIKPVLNVNDEGKLIPRSKKIGRKPSLNELVERLEQTIDKSFKQTIFISHGDCLEDALYVKELIEQLNVADNYLLNYIGPVIASHAGPGTVAVFYVGEKR